MLRSMFAGVSGLRNHQLRMDVIGNNIANVNTTGYKMSRVTFQEMYSQTLRGASSPTANTGGTNPQQVGLGVSTASIDVVHEGGGAQSTDRALDFYIEGEGFFTVRQGEQFFYTRAGNLYLDEKGFLVTANGMYVQGVNLIPDTHLPTSPALTPAEITALNQKTAVEFNAMDMTRIDENDLGRILIPSEGFTQFIVDQNGRIKGLDEHNDWIDLGQLTVATYVNPEGLTSVGNSLYQISNNSGPPQYKAPGSGGSGEVIAGKLEMSNVDLSKEFTDMIITQRGFQANSRVITVSDTLLEELINLKR